MKKIELDDGQKAQHGAAVADGVEAFAEGIRLGHQRLKPTADVLEVALRKRGGYNRGEGLPGQLGDLAKRLEESVADIEKIYADLAGVVARYSN